MSELKSRLPGKYKPDLDAFLSGADEKTKPEKTIPKHKSKYSWESAGVREDVTKVYNLRLSEPYLLKLKYIAEQTPDSMQKFCINVLEKEIDKKIKELTK
ncbi:conserved hypothetical protein [Bathymodiolus platifrons methanotrophic gill symbiont]|uniref:hypothetical protein n=1 Tax=Bathymodiolus platifrons methanotrophic gill symbiont TaxID=113268 RepID=UPI000B413089|nr:hypothetical protein [Bathymodiolus platifrons methanotrophic gill symbiont]TXL09653.1 hypothetical protein BMR08_12825 [Methylococcaceae bacterium CS2]GAW86311.1 conserved hypothetical protein [Bathymodiolus platifrons methanotrophic gill symbiont]GFO73854.1 hypothetical protein BPLS_P0162 [Bathymodiolus platifrons methanotrophic gill symbiont]